MDEKLIKAIKEMAEGKESGFNTVYSETYNHVYFRAKQHMNNDEDAQDLTQIVFVEAFRNIASLQAPEALYGWLDRIAYNQGMKLYRKKKELLLSEEGEGVFDTLESNDIESMPELSMDQKETSKIIREIIDELPEAQKVALIAYYYDHFSVGQIAEMEECSEGTIKSRLNYARKYLKDRIEEKEKKEGYRLHAFTLPLLWWAIKFMADGTTMSAETAQIVYNGACSGVGLQASTIAVSGAAAGKMAAGVEAAKVGIASNSAKAAAGIGAKFAALSSGTKALVIAGALAVTGTGIGGVMYAVNSTRNEINIDNMEAKMDFSDAEKNQLGIAICYAKNNDLLNGSDNYVYNTRLYIDNVLNGRDYVEGLLPLGWNSNIVSEETVKTFWKDGFGIEIPDGYNYFDTPFWGDVSCNSEPCWDRSMERLTIKEMNVTDNTDGTYTIRGIILYGDIFDTSTEGDIEEAFSAVCELSGNMDVFGGYRIISFDESATNDTSNNTSNNTINSIGIDFDDLAEKYAAVAASADPFEKFYIDDINSDGIPEFIMTTPYASEAEKMFLIYSYNPAIQSPYTYGATGAGHAVKLFSYVDNNRLIVESIHMGYDEAYDADPTNGSFDLIYSHTYPVEEYGNLKPTYVAGEGIYEIPPFADGSVNGIKNELKRFQ